MDKPPVLSMWSGNRRASPGCVSRRRPNSASVVPRGGSSPSGTPACSDRMRMANCSADISSEKKPTMPPRPVLRAVGCGAAARRHVEGDVGGERRLTHRGRPASTIRSEGCRPPIFLSRSMKPVEMPASRRRACEPARPCRARQRSTSKVEETPGRTCPSRRAQRAGSRPPRSAPSAGSPPAQS